MANQKGVMESYEESPVSIRTKLSFFWTTVTLLYLYGDYFELYIPGKVEGLLDGRTHLNSPFRLLAAGILLGLPAMMVILSSILKPSMNRKVNISIAILLSGVTIMVAINSITLWRSLYLLMAIVESCLTIVIACTAWNWPRIQNHPSGNTKHKYV